VSEQAGSAPRDLSAGELTVQLGNQVSQLLRDELALARAELFARARQAVLGGGMLGAGALLGLTGWLALVAAAIAAIAVALPVWAAALIVGGFLVLVAGGVAARGGRRLSRMEPLTMTAQSIRQDVQEVKERAARH
jgi:hypothetical protein